MSGFGDGNRPGDFFRKKVSKRPEAQEGDTGALYDDIEEQHGATPGGEEQTPSSTHPEPEVRAGFNRGPGETVLLDYGNAFIVSGQDRFASWNSGTSLGSNGAANASMMDLVVGRGGWDVQKETLYDPNFKGDAARIYISQLADVDRYFDLAICQGGVPPSEARSAIGIKADAVRIVGREGIKLVTRTEQVQSKGEKIKIPAPGIELIAGNNTDDVEPIVKAHKLRKCIERIFELFSQLITDIKRTNRAIKSYMRSMSLHTHVVPPGVGIVGGPTLPSAMASVGYRLAKQPLKISDKDLTSLSNQINVNDVHSFTKDSGEFWFGSAFNKTN